jgi:hypothetical protein
MGGDQPLGRREHDLRRSAAGRTRWAQRDAHDLAEHRQRNDGEPRGFRPARLAAVAAGAVVGAVRVGRHGTTVVSSLIVVERQES